MSALNSISQLDLRPKPGFSYFNIDREWREEFIYFLMVDRFQDDQKRQPVLKGARASGIQTPDDFYGGKIRGITRNLDYIAGLGCTAIWLSPVFENNPRAYHGYNINNYLDLDPNFGTKEDLAELVDAAHHFKKNGKPYPIRIILDVVINHSGDNWFYKDEDKPGVDPYTYCDGIRFDFGDWRRHDRPIPIELRNPDLYHRKGNIGNAGGYDSFPESQHGDMCGLKDYSNDDDDDGSKLIDILVKSHCYWIRETDVDGFRVDAVKHMGPLTCCRFCTNIREYAYSLGKRGFFLFGELAASNDEIYNQYIGQNTSVKDGNKTVFFGLNSLLDFRLAKGDDYNAALRSVIKGDAGPETLFNRQKAQQSRALNQGEIGRYLVSFIDNHDTFWQPDGRFGARANDQQVIGGIGFLLCTLGTPCIYYGTEQGFSGAGCDNNVREAMFDKNKPGQNLLNTQCVIYQEIAKIASVMRSSEPLRFGRQYYREISGNGEHFGLPYGSDYTLAFSRIVYGREILVAYNVSENKRDDKVIVDASLHASGDLMNFLYGGVGNIEVQEASGGEHFVQLSLEPFQFVILQ
jgi:glycosidase